MTLTERTHQLKPWIAGRRGWQRLGLAFLCGVGATAGMAPYHLLPLLVAGFSILFIFLSALAQSNAPHSGRKAFFVGWAFGFGYFITGIYWMGFAFLVRAEEFAWMVPIAIPLFSLFLALFFALPSFIFLKIARKIPAGELTTLFLFVALISMFEYLRGHILTGLPWNLVGQSMVGVFGGAQTASFYGVYGLSLVVLVFATLPAVHLSTRHRPTMDRQSAPGPSHGNNFLSRNPIMREGVVWSLVGFVALFLIGSIRLALTPTTNRADVSITIVQPNISQKDKINPDLTSKNFDRLLTISSPSAPRAPVTDQSPNTHLLLWPENAVSWIDEQPYVLQRIHEAIDPATTIITGSIRRDKADRYYNTMGVLSVVDNTRTVTRFYDKHHLVPFGEYLPLKTVLTFLGLSQLAPVQDGFAPGKGPETFSISGINISPLICYEAIFPGALYPAGKRPDLMITSTNDAWFGDGAGPRQHLDQARLRSIESGVAMARSANTGISALIDPVGRIAHHIDLYKDGQITAAIPNALPRTFYDRFGDGFYFFMLISMGLGIIISWRSVNKHAGSS